MTEESPYIPGFKTAAVTALKLCVIENKTSATTQNLPFLRSYFLEIFSVCDFYYTSISQMRLGGAVQSQSQLVLISSG